MAYQKSFILKMNSSLNMMISIIKKSISTRFIPLILKPCATMYKSGINGYSVDKYLQGGYTIQTSVAGS